ncbi:MAG: dihydrofolate reductase [SAR202 cluster bacterium]|nr:dihydrofolate reductase [Chloroflexota bacterium]MQG35863.1 dihydrofolate reductase [SAR202 cluster bacterium]MQG86683.1 dihydrofolate reductase [SAR202 cluster bacterium]|tara:strand:- start:8372 stop:9319 length:948 start_codon:yes stop_codon:yes gene_type:complete
MLKKNILISAPYFQPVVDKYMHVFEQYNLKPIVPKVTERLEEHELLEVIHDIQGTICGDDRFTPKVLDAAKQLSVISKWGTGIDSIDKAYANQKNIQVFNTPNAFTNPVSDTVLGYILTFARQLHAMDTDVKKHIWEKRNLVSLYECTLGIIGLGNIGQAIARKASSFGIRILGHDPCKPPKEFLDSVSIELVSKDFLLSKSDFITLNCDLNDSSLHILSTIEFTNMAKKPYIINAARGPLIDEIALVKALKDGKIKGAALDVFEDEPLPPTSELRSLENVLLAPHNSNSSPDAWEKVHEQTLNNLLVGLGIWSK